MYKYASDTNTAADILGLLCQEITNKFPSESLPHDGKIIPHQIIDGNIKGINGRRNFDFVVDKEGKLVIGDKHHLLGNRESVQAAGQIRLNGKGQIRQIDNLSGHYQPTVAEATNFPRILREAGLNVNGATMVIHQMTTNASGLVTGLEVVARNIIK